MKKYEFRLQKLLDIRVDREQESIMEFQKARKESMKIKKKVDMLKENYNEYKDISKVKDTVERKITRVYLNALNYNINEAECELNKKEKVVCIRREKLKKCQIERKTVDILKDKERIAYIKEQNRIEQKTNDEFALYGFIRKVKNEHI